MRQMYSYEPWIYPRVPDKIREIYGKYGESCRHLRGELIALGDPDGPVFLLEEGLIATYAGGEGFFSRALGLFAQGSLLGAVRTLTQKPCDLMGRVLCDVRGRRMSGTALRSLLCADLFTLRGLLPFLMSMPEAQMEGLVTNATLDAAGRLRALLHSLIVAAGREVEPGWNRIPYDLTTDDFGSITHLTRVTVSREFSKWTKAGLLRRNAQALYADARLFADSYDWMGGAQKREP